MLDSESIKIWRVRLEEHSLHATGYSPTQLAEWLGMLSREEQARAAAFHREEHSRDYIVAHAALRLVMGRQLGIPPSAVDFDEGSFAGTNSSGGSVGRIKPKLRPPSRALAESGWNDVRFNLTHTHGAALIGLTSGRELGIDIERERPMVHLEGMAQSVMSPDEWKEWSTVRVEDQSRAFYRLWTRKEAYLKGIGLGLYRDLQAVTVPVSAHLLAAEQMHRVRDAAGPAVWQVVDIEAGLGFAAALALEGEEKARLIVRDLDLGAP